jgi:branched-chain amino acid transport system substrate-binding protein
MMLRKMIGRKARLLDQFDKAQPVLEKTAQRPAVAVKVIENTEIQHAGDSVTALSIPASLPKTSSTETALGRTVMRKTLLFIAAAMLLASSANAQQTVKLGLIMSYSGQFADPAAQMDNAIKLYIKQHGDTVAGKKIEIIRKDTGGPNPDVAKRLAQELIVRDNVDILAGFVLTPEALGAGDVSAEAKKLMVVMNAATSIITTKSPYIVRTSLTIPQLQNTFGGWAYKTGLRKIYTMVSDYGPGIDAETWFVKSFKEAGGQIVGSVRMPVANPDFSAFVQRAKDLEPEAIFIFIPGGTQPPAMTKAMQERGIPANKILGQGEITMDDNALKSMGDSATGIRTAFHYSWEHKSAMNEAFVKAYRAEFNRNPDVFSIGGWDGMHLIYETLKKTGGKADGDTLIAAAKGMKWESPRGPISIDPDTRDIVQTVYIRRVEKVGDRSQNVEIDRIENVKDPAKK